VGLGTSSKITFPVNDWISLAGLKFLIPNVASNYQILIDLRVSIQTKVEKEQGNSRLKRCLQPGERRATTNSNI
jgi:hypothetical protein